MICVEGCAPKAGNNYIVPQNNVPIWVRNGKMLQNHPVFYLSAPGKFSPGLANIPVGAPMRIDSSLVK